MNYVFVSPMFRLSTLPSKLHIKAEKSLNTLNLGFTTMNTVYDLNEPRFIHYMNFTRNKSNNHLKSKGIGNLKANIFFKDLQMEVANKLYYFFSFLFFSRRVSLYGSHWP
jgi:hypothetical protein